MIKGAHRWVAAFAALLVASGCTYRREILAPALAEHENLVVAFAAPRDLAVVTPDGNTRTLEQVTRVGGYSPRATFDTMYVQVRWVGDRSGTRWLHDDVTVRLVKDASMRLAILQYDPRSLGISSAEMIGIAAGAALIYLARTGSGERRGGGS